MAAKNEHSILWYKSDLPNTYLTLLPRELFELLYSYYFGSLEITIIHLENSLQGFSIHKYDNANRIQAAMSLKLEASELYTAYISKPNDGYIIIDEPYLII